MITEFFNSLEPVPLYVQYILVGVPTLCIMGFFVWANYVLNVRTEDPNPKHENTL